MNLPTKSELTAPAQPVREPVLHAIGENLLKAPTKLTAGWVNAAAKLLEQLLAERQTLYTGPDGAWPAPAPTAARNDMVKEFSSRHHDLIVVMQAAWIEWRRRGNAVTAMDWIENTLMGPGLIPGEDEPYASEPQAYFDKNKANPFPECFCGRPSNQLWMGKGFCGPVHYRQHRAAGAEGGAA